VTFATTARLAGKATVAYEDAVLADSPLVYLRLNEASGSTSTDSSGNSRTFTIDVPASVTFGATGATSDGDDAYQFTGNTTTYANSASWMDQSSFTVEVWYKSSSAASAQWIASRVGSFDSNYSWSLLLISGTLTGYINQSQSSLNAIDVTDTTTTNDGNWHHAAMTYNGTTLTLYRDGTSRDTASPSGFQHDPSALMRVGSLLIAGDKTVCPYLDEYAFYGSALSSTRVSAHYAAA
jgi:hypothetical protein